MPRSPDEPTPEKVLDAMDRCESYNVSDLRSEFEDTSRWTIQRRLDDLVDQGRIQKKKHDNGNVSYWVD